MAKMIAKTTKRPRTKLRAIRITRKFTEAPGSVLFEMGQTRILCTASFEPSVPPWRTGSGKGWVTAEYNMLPSSTIPRKPRPRSGHTDSRGVEIQRLIGRVLRSVVDFKNLGENTICIDCDVLQADGGTRTAAINGGFIALTDAITYGLKQKHIPKNPLTGSVGAISVGRVHNKTILDLDYELDSQADVDLNVAMTHLGEFVELQGTGEQSTFSREHLDSMLRLAHQGIRKIITVQKKSLQRRVTTLT